MKLLVSLFSVGRVARLVSATLAGVQFLGAAPVSFVLTSDLHYGLNRSSFRGAANVPAVEVNGALADAINAVPRAMLPADGGVAAGERVGALAFIAVTGDIANRQEAVPLRIQPAAVSWAQFEESFARRLSILTQAGTGTPLMVVPGNHDLSNAIGWVGTMIPARDATAMAGIYNRMMNPAEPRTATTWRYPEDTVRVMRDFGGVRCVFFTIWPDSATRAWLERELATVPATMPVFLFCHDQPDIEAKHLRNPNGDHGLNSKDRFENLVGDTLAEGSTVDAPTTREQRALVEFLARHRNVVAYFHGNANWNEFYTWSGPDRAIALNVFRADSTIKGRESGKDERRLSFQVATFDLETRQLTVREFLWNAGATAGRAEWGTTRTVSLAPRER
jgi:hypothetical protein